MDGDDCDVGIGISSLKGEVYFEAILVICCHRRNTYDNLNKKKKDCFRFQLHDGPQENTPTIQSVQTQSSRAAIQTGFLSYQVDVFTWDPNLLGGNVFCLVRQKSLLECGCSRTGSGHPRNQTLTSCDIIKQGL